MATATATAAAVVALAAAREGGGPKGEKRCGAPVTAGGGGGAAVPSLVVVLRDPPRSPPEMRPSTSYTTSSPGPMGVGVEEETTAGLAVLAVLARDLAVLGRDLPVLVLVLVLALVLAPVLVRSASPLLGTPPPTQPRQRPAGPFLHCLLEYEALGTSEPHAGQARLGQGAAAAVEVAVEVAVEEAFSLVRWPECSILRLRGGRRILEPLGWGEQWTVLRPAVCAGAWGWKTFIYLFILFPPIRIG